MSEDQPARDDTTNTRDLARAFLNGITEGSPEDDARIWFENAPPEVRLATFIRLRVQEDQNGR